MNNTFIIAEAGANHDRKIEQAFKLIDIAIEAGADAVKFQTYSADTMYSKNTPDFAQYKNVSKLIKSLELPREWQKDLLDYCSSKEIEFMSTPFDEKAVDELYSLGVSRFKIAGFESTDPRFVKYIAATKLPLIISLGIGTSLDTMQEIYSWVKEVNEVPEVTFLHCNNAYPTPFKDINLGQMKEMMCVKPHEKVRIGLSDHTEGILTPPIAVSIGATVIEKHYTVNRNLPGPDHPFAIEPNELKSMVKNIRLVETMLGIKEAKYTKSEQDFSMARRSVVLNGNVGNGYIVTENNITTKRPLLNDSIPAIEYYSILGKTFNKDLVDDHILKWSDINE